MDNVGVNHFQIYLNLESQNVKKIWMIFQVYNISYLHYRIFFTTLKCPSLVSAGSNIWIFAVKDTIINLFQD